MTDSSTRPEKQEPWRVCAGASITGSSHRKVEEGCQDAHAIHVVGNMLIVAVCDGAGSSSMSDVGAKTVADELVAYGATHHETVRKILTDLEAWSAVSREAFEHALHNLQETATRLACPVDEFATTTILVIATPTSVATAQVGDGGVVVSGEDELFTVSCPEHGEHVNETAFLTSPDALGKHFRTNIWQGNLKHLCTFTDGLEHLILRYPDFVPHAAFFLPFFQNIDTTSNPTTFIESMLSGERFQRRTSDDLTLFVAAPRHPPQDN